MPANNFEIGNRKSFFYPPFSRIIQIVCRHKEKYIAEEAANILAQSLTKLYGQYISGPAEPPVNRVRNQYIYEQTQDKYGWKCWMFRFHRFLLVMFLFDPWNRRISFRLGTAANFFGDFSFPELESENQETFRERWAAKERAIGFGW